MSNKTKLRRVAGRDVRRGAGTGTPPVWRRIALPLITFAAGALLAGPIGAATNSPAAGSEQSIRQLQLGDAKRDADQVVSLTAQARRVADSLLPVLDGLSATVPAGGTTPGPVAPAPQIALWKAATQKAVTEFADPPSAGTAVNITRSSFAAAVRQLDLAVGTYAEAATAPDPSRPALLALAGRQRDNAVATWSIGATALDVLNIDTGHGHQHVYLPSSSGQGAMTSDGSKEGG
jgi:hypothetical protein